MLNIQDVRDLVIRPVLELLDLRGRSREQLLIGTALQESGLRKLRQWNQGPALGIFQMEPATHNDIWSSWLKYRPEFSQPIETLCHSATADCMAWNLRYAAAMAAIHYRRVPTALPVADDIEGHAKYWKLHYNTPAGKGKIEEYIQKWNQYQGSA